MSFTVDEYLDLVRLLGEHPEWRAELRRLLLADDILELPRIVRELAEAQQRTEAQLVELAAAQQRTEVVVRELVEAQQRTEAQLVELAAAQQRTEVVVRELVEAQKQILKDLSPIKGWSLEDRYRNHAYAYFGRWLRRARTVDLADLTAVEEAHASGQLSAQEWEYLTALDVLVRGVVGKGAQARDAFLALEVSWVIDQSDVERAHRRATTLRRLGYTAIGGVGGNSISAEAEERARALGVVVALHGRILVWPQGNGNAEHPTDWSAVEI